MATYIHIIVAGLNYGHRCPPRKLHADHTRRLVHLFTQVQGKSIFSTSNRYHVVIPHCIVRVKNLIRGDQSVPIKIYEKEK